MNRRDFLTTSTLAAAASLADAGDAPTVDLVIGGSRQLPPIPASFMGLGYEISSVARPGLLSGANLVYQNLVRRLGAQGVIRVGGNTADYAHYSPGATAVSSPYRTVVNPAALRELREFLQATGWQLIWALNLGSATATEAVAEAKAVMAVAGRHLLAFEIGNEPDLFSREKHRPAGYSYEAWLAEYRRFKAVLQSGMSHTPLAGPDVAGRTDWVTRFAVDEGKDVVLLTHHYYREGQNPQSTVEKLLGTDPKLQPQLDQLHAASASSGVPYRICEVNSFSGGGRPGVSDTMAAALWALDYLYTLAESGCAGVNMETGVNQLGFISAYSPIGDDDKGHYLAKPEYYGLLAFSLLGHGALLACRLAGSPASIKAYATSSAERPLCITLINKAATPCVLRIDPGRTGHETADVLRLAASGVYAETGVTLGGAQVSPQGDWAPTQRETLRRRNGHLIVPLPAFSAALVESN